jgi:hypothetical protein
MTSAVLILFSNSLVLSSSKSTTLIILSITRSELLAGALPQALLHRHILLIGIFLKVAHGCPPPVCFLLPLIIAVVGNLTVLKNKHIAPMGFYGFFNLREKLEGLVSLMQEHTMLCFIHYAHTTILLLILTCATHLSSYSVEDAEAKWSILALCPRQSDCTSSLHLEQL